MERTQSLRGTKTDKSKIISLEKGIKKYIPEIKNLHNTQLL